MEPFLVIRDEVDRRGSLDARFLFYLASVVDASAKIEKALTRRPVVCDRFIATTLCWHEVIGVEVHRQIAGLSIIRPDLTLLVDAKTLSADAAFKLAG